jgi:hypothetical protein
MRRAVAAAIGSVAALLLPMAAQAQVSEPTLTPSAALQCLTPPAAERGKLAYPEDALQRKDGGTVSVELRFTGPDAAPGVRVLNDDQAYDALKAAVRRHVGQYRVPCMKEGDPPVLLRQDFVFTPNDGRKVVATTPSDAGDEERREQMRCLVQTGQRKVPEYPWLALQNDVQGNLLVRMRFSAPDRPPQMEVLAGTKKGSLRDSVEQFVAGYRLPCLKGPELSVNTLFMFRIDGGARSFLKDMPLRDFISVTTNHPLPAYFDLNAMACPFELRVQYMQPHEPNKIGELDGPVAARKPFLDWLSRLTLNAPEKTNTELLGNEFTLSVPCGKVDL